MKKNLILYTEGSQLDEVGTVVGGGGGGDNCGGGVGV